MYLNNLMLLVYEFLEEGSAKLLSGRGKGDRSMMHFRFYRDEMLGQRFNRRKSGFWSMPAHCKSITRVQLAVIQPFGSWTAPAHCKSL